MADHHSQEIIDDQETSEIPKTEEHPVSQTAEHKQENPDSIGKIQSKGSTVQDHVIKRSNKQSAEESDLPDADKDDQHLSRFPIYPNESGSRSISSSSDERKNDRFRLVGVSLDMTPRLRDFRASLEMMMKESSEMAEKTEPEKECIIDIVEDLIEALDKAEIESSELMADKTESEKECILEIVDQLIDTLNRAEAEDDSRKVKLEKKEKKVEKLSYVFEEVRMKNSSLQEQLDNMIKKMSTNTTINKAEIFHKPHHHQIDESDEKTIKSDEDQKPISSEQFIGTVQFITLSPPSSDDEELFPSGPDCDEGTRRLVFIYKLMKKDLLSFKELKIERKMEDMIDDMINLLAEAEDKDNYRQEEIEKNQKMARMLWSEIKEERLTTSRLELQLDVMGMKMTNKDQEQHSGPSTSTGEFVAGDTTTVEHSAKCGDADEGCNKEEQGSPTGAGERDVERVN